MSAGLEAERRDLLEAALPHIPFDGWSARTLRLACRDLGLDRALAQRAFPRGARDLLAFFVAEADRRMVAELSALDLGAMRVRQRIAAAVRLRLELHAGHREAVRRALALGALPTYSGDAVGALYRTVDLIWRAAGDEATDFNFYSKRALLAGVYGSTILYWLDDQSEDFADTWAFLDRRIGDVMRVQKARGRLGEFLQRLAPRRLRPLHTEGPRV
jgi:ubiquinone biosynthesis protein COQ9